MMAPYIVLIENFLPIITNGATAWMAQPKTTGKPIPKYLLRINCNSVASPHMKMSIETR